jgi:uncharacterized protein YndB with AHSA1/START domain
MPSSDPASPTAAPMGVPVYDGGWAVRYVRHLAHAPEKVWRALTESHHLEHWMPADIVGERRAGARIELPFWADTVEKYELEDPVLTGEIRVWDPPRTFEWTWDTDLLRWELEPDGDGTRHTFTTWLGDVEPEATANTGAGYHVCLDQLADLLELGVEAMAARSTAEVDEAVVDAWQERYAEAIEAAAPEG